jgi:inner membrane protein
MVEYLGWSATAVFVSSYFCRSARALRRMQMVGAVIWMAYAIVMGAAPVFVANLLVLCAAAWTAARSSPGDAPVRTDAAPG